MKYVALLRGINVGGNTKVPMEELRQLFSQLGFAGVKTLLNSGNVIFEAKEKNENILREKIEEELEKHFGFLIRTLIRSQEEMRQLLEEDPFKDIEVTKDIRLYVTFLSRKHSVIKNEIQEVLGKDAIITRLTDREICSVITITPGKNTTDLMGFLERVFGKEITTRNWNTIKKLV
jgi:uncharacterized protein (DUF1697 family)